MALATQVGLNFGSANVAAGGTGGISSRGTTTLGQKVFLGQGQRSQNSAVSTRGWPGLRQPTPTASAAVLDVGAFAPNRSQPWKVPFLPDQWQPVTPEQDGRSLSTFFNKLLDPSASAEFPPAHKVDKRALDNRELDKLVANLGRNKSTWRRALQLHEWLLGLGHAPDDRLCTTLMRVCSQHGHAVEALNLYDWMRSSKREGGPGLRPTVYTYTGAMRAALSGNLVDRALQVWEDAMAAGCQPDCRMCTTLIEVCTRKGHSDRALQMYELMRDAPAGSKLAPSVHAFTAAMRAAAEGGYWERALDIWQDMEKAGCRATGHAYAAAISACAVGGAWQHAVRLFDEMLDWQIKPDVVSCTALITALGADGQWIRAERVLEWMLKAGVRPNVRTYTALVTAMGNAREWDHAIYTIQRMKANPEWGNVEPNAYTYSALLKTMGEHGEWEMAEELFEQLEAEALGVSDGQGTAASFRVACNYEEMNGALAEAAAQQLAGLSVVERAPSRESLDYGTMPTLLAEQVLESNSPKLGDTLPDSIPGQSNFFNTTSSSSADSPAESSATNMGGLAETSGQDAAFSFFGTVDDSSAESSAVRSVWTISNAAVSGLYGAMPVQQIQTALPPLHVTEPARRLVENHGWNGGAKVKGSLNEVVCGSLMLAYERANCWEKAVGVLERARRLGIEPNTIMYNTAMSALGKCGEWQQAEALFQEVSHPDAISYETMIAAYGISGQATKAEVLFEAMLKAGYVPRDYAFCGLIAAHSNDGNWRAALRVRQRMQRLGSQPTVHAYNAFLAACDRASQWDQAMHLHRAMKMEGVVPNQMTMTLLASVGKGGVSAVEDQQIATAALTAAVAAAGSIIIKSGLI